MNQALFVDLSNFYSHLLESGIVEDQRLLRHYFLHWLDFDRLAKVLTGEFSSVWVFYSGRRFGPKPNRVDDIFLDEYVQRINSLRGVTARNVNIPGKQRESTTYQCEECGHEGTAQWESEKGIDASLIVHLFDTMDSWDTAFLLSGDADFVPAVSSLRRRGKIVIGVGFSAVSSALVRECYDYIDLRESFLDEDFALCELFSEGGVVHRWLTDEVSDSGGSRPVTLRVRWKYSESYCLLRLEMYNSRALSVRRQLVEGFQEKFSGYLYMSSIDAGYEFVVSSMAWEGLTRRIGASTLFLENLEGVKFEQIESVSGSYTMEY